MPGSMNFRCRGRAKRKSRVGWGGLAARDRSLTAVAGPPGNVAVPTEAPAGRDIAAGTAAAAATAVAVATVAAAIAVVATAAAGTVAAATVAAVVGKRPPGLAS